MKIAIFIVLLWTTYLTGCKPKCPGDEYIPVSASELSKLQPQGRQAIFKSNTGMYDTVTYGNWEYYEESSPTGADYHCHAHTVTKQIVKQKINYMINARDKIVSIDGNYGFCIEPNYYCSDYYNTILYHPINNYELQGIKFNEVIVKQFNISDSLYPIRLVIGVHDGIIMQEYLINNQKDTLRWMLQK